MKRFVIFLLVCTLLFSGCSNKAEQPSVQMGNPWSDHETLAQAEAAVGFSLGLPETVADTYKAETFRTLNDSLLEVVYRDDDLTVTVRKQAGEGQDISGDYSNYPTIHETILDTGTVIEKNDGTSFLTLVDHDGYSYSLSAPNGYRGDSAEAFLAAIFA